MQDVVYKLGTENIQDVKMLFKEYSLIGGAEICFVSFEKELSNLQEVYALPNGSIIVAYYENLPVGCVALKSINETMCEMKRLYVKPEYRKLGIGEHFIKTIIKISKDIGYEYLSLETLPEIMENAIRLYKRHGFEEVSNNYGILNMQINL